MAYTALNPRVLCPLPAKGEEGVAKEERAGGRVVEGSLAWSVRKENAPGMLRLKGAEAGARWGRKGVDRS